MLIKGLVDEDFVNYKKPSMFICANECSFKCEKESEMSCCHNSSLARAESVDVSYDNIIRRYLHNPITKAIVIGGLEPFDQFDEVFELVYRLRNDYKCYDDFVIYTGFNKTEILSSINRIKQLGNIIVKFGRFVPNEEGRFDEILGVHLASKNQYAEVIA